MSKLKLKKPQDATGFERLLSTAELAQLLGMSDKFLHNDRYLAKVEDVPPKFPYYKLPSGAIRYRLSEIEAVLQSGHEGG